jgi:predicted RNA-binding protein with PUA-like domain
MQYWLFKSEPDVFSFDHLKSCQREPWTGVRNYQARNMMRDQMKCGDQAFFYHSSCPNPGIAGIAKVDSAPYADPTQFDPQSEYYDAKSTSEQPRWQLIDLAWYRDLPRFLPLTELRNIPQLSQLILLQKGTRLSITPIEPSHFYHILNYLNVTL